MKKLRKEKMLVHGEKLAAKRDAIIAMKANLSLIMIWKNMMQTKRKWMH